MFANLDILRMAQSLATHAGLRQQAIAQNVANADTPGYQARDAVPFADFLDATARARQAPPPRPDSLMRPDADPATRSPDGNTVSLEHEMMRGATVRGQHELALGIYSSARDLLRASIGR
jgi:flagellar basal-body rod protein FlgB